MTDPAETLRRLVSTLHLTVERWELQAHLDDTLHHPRAAEARRSAAATIAEELSALGL